MQISSLFYGCVIAQWFDSSSSLAVLFISTNPSLKMPSSNCSGVGYAAEDEKYGVRVQIIDKTTAYPMSQLSHSLAHPFPCHSQRNRNVSPRRSPPNAITSQFPILNQRHLSVPFILRRLATENERRTGLSPRVESHSLNWETGTMDSTTSTDQTKEPVSIRLRHPCQSE